MAAYEEAEEGIKLNFVWAVWRIMFLRREGMNGEGMLIKSTLGRCEAHRGFFRFVPVAKKR